MANSTLESSIVVEKINPLEEKINIQNLLDGYNSDCDRLIVHPYEKYKRRQDPNYVLYYTDYEEDRESVCNFLKDKGVNCKKIRINHYIDNDGYPRVHWLISIKIKLK